MQTNSMRHEKVVKLPRNEVAAFLVAVVGRDSLTSGLLADALVHNLKCETVVTRHSELLRELGTRKIDLVIISAEAGSSTSTGIELASSVFLAHPKIPIVILMNDPANDMVLHAFRAGARGVFNPQDSISDFIDCVDHVKRGLIWAGREVTDCLLQAIRSMPAPLSVNKGDGESLTARELQVVQCAAKGRTNKEIASELHLSEHTVKNYLFKAFEKLGVSSRVELLFYLTVQRTAYRLTDDPRSMTEHDD
jgi:two-component system, NarL family, nitrate/nitrite response regulator NarL